MTNWSAENATKAYLNTLQMGQKDKEPNVAEFISAIAAGNNAQVMFMACSGVADHDNTLALLAAAHQTDGHVICIIPGIEQLHLSRVSLGPEACQVQFVVGEARKILLTQQRDADFVLVDCNLENYEGIFKDVVELEKKGNGRVVVGYNAFCKGSFWSYGLRTQLLPIGNGLLITRVD